MPPFIDRAMHSAAEPQPNSEPRIARMTRMGRTGAACAVLRRVSAAHPRHSRNPRLKIVAKKQEITGQ